MSNKMTMSKFCRIGGVSPVSISHKTGIPIKDLNKIFYNNIHDFNNLVTGIKSMVATRNNGIIILEDPKRVQKVYVDDYISFAHVTKIFGPTPKRIKAWLVLDSEAIKTVIFRGKRYLRFGSVCDFVASGKA